MSSVNEMYRYYNYGNNGYFLFGNGLNINKNLVECFSDYFSFDSNGKILNNGDSDNHFYADMNSLFLSLYGDRETNSINSAFSDWYSKLLALGNANAYKYKTLYETIIAEYNPIENYSMTESGTDILDKTGNISNELTMQNGNKKTETKNNSVTDTTTESTYPYNNNTKTSTNSTDVNYGGRSETITSDSYTDTQRSIQNNNTSDITTHEFKRSGNIGVTTTQQMLESSRKLAQFSLFMEWFKDIDKYILGGWV